MGAGTPPGSKLDPKATHGQSPWGASEGGGAPPPRPLVLSVCFVLGAFLGFFEAVLGSLGQQNLEKLNVFLRFLQMQICASLMLLMVLLGPYWPLLGPIWPPNGPQNSPQSGPKMVQKIVLNMTPKNVKFKPILGPKMDPKMCCLGDQEERAQEAGAILKALVSKMPPSRVKTSPNSSR